MKKRSAILAVSSLLYLAPQMVVVQQAQADATGTSKQPISNELMWDASGKVTDPLTENNIGYSAVYGVQRSALQYDLTNVATNIVRATLRIHITQVEDITPGDSIKPKVTLIGSTDDNWSDNNSAAPSGAGDQTIDTKLDVAVGTAPNPWLEFDVTDFVKSQVDASGDKVVTFVLKGEETQPGVQSYYANHLFTSDASLRPELELEFGATTPPALAPVVTPTTVVEDTKSSTGLSISPNSSETTSVTHYKISEIVGGRVYLHDGSTLVGDGSFIPVSEAVQGLVFEPASNANSLEGGHFSFNVRAAQDGTGTGLSDPAEVQISVSEVNDRPVVTNDVTEEIQEDSGALRIPFSWVKGNDNAGASNESAQTLTVTSVTGSSVGGTVTVDGDAFVFTPDLNFNGTASFQYQVEDNGTTNGSAHPESATATVSIPVAQVADLPQFSWAWTAEDEQTSSGLQISANPVDGAAVQYFKIGAITGGKLYKNDGTFELNQGDFITRSEGEAGLKFTPATNTNDEAGDTFSVMVQAALDQSDTGLSAPAKAEVHVSEVNDNPVVQDDHLSAVEENAGEQVIAVDKLLENDKSGPTNEGGQTMTITAVGNAVGGTVRLDDSKTHVIFLPTNNFRGTARFEYTVEDDGSTNGVVNPQTATATASFTISARADAPQVTPATTAEDTQTTNGLVITPTSSGGATATHFKISGITGGQLYQHDGLQRISNGDFITVAEGGAGLKFTPDTNAHGTSGFGFSVQAAPGTDGSLLSDAVPVSITVTAVNDDPKAEHDTLQQVAKGTPKVTISFSDLLRNDVAGPADEQSTQTLTVTDVSGAVGGTVSIVDGHVEFVPNADFMGTASFAYTVSDGEKTDTSSAQFEVVDEDQPTITLNGDDTLYLLKGQAYVEPGYSAYDEVDHDLTDHVTVTGSVDTSTLGTYELHYNVKDSSNNAASSKTRTVHIVSSDLSALSVGTDGLTPMFQADTLAYTLKVPSNVKDLNITATAADPTANVTIYGVAKGHGGTQPVSLMVGKNEITIVVTAQGGSTTTYHLEVTRSSAPTNPGNGNGNGPKTRQAKVVTGEMTDANIVQVDITRTAEANGKIVDSVALKGTKVDEVVAKAAADSADTARIVIDDLPDEPADEVGANISSEALRKLKGADLGLVIEASGARITLSADTLSQLSDSGKDLFFRVVPIRKQDETKQVKDRVLDAQELQQYANGKNVRAVGQPMTIETNYTNRKTKVMFPLTGIDIPTDPQARTAFLNGLGIFIEHTDGQKEVETGQLVYDEAGKPIGLEIGVEKFSTFTFVSTDADFKTYLHYVSGYPDGTFHPNDNITRAETASLIARQMELNAAASADRYSDLPATHWASKAVLQLTAAGILSGDVNGSFRPEGSVTRAEMAVIAAKLKGLNLTGAGNAFSDAQGHWAATAIAAVQQAGLMSGYEDGTFRPDQTLTRAEAVVVLNRLFQRPQLLGQQLATWPDVTLSDWVSADIESASHDFRVYKDGSITITDFKKQNQ